jgi:protoporphyrinogen oxidase
MHSPGSAIAAPAHDRDHGFPTRVAIIGGGVTGLTAAYDLAGSSTAALPIQVDVFEGGTELGGLAAGFRGRPEWEWPLERFYHHLFTNDDAIISLTDEIGLADKLTIHSPITAMYRQGNFYPLDTPMRVLRFPLIPLIDRLRMGAVLAYLRYNPAHPWQQYDGIVADEWLSRWMGKKAYGGVWQPMLQGKFGQRYGQVNLAWFWARIYKRTPKLGYFKGGFQAFVDGLAAAAEGRGSTIHTQNPIAGIVRLDSGEFSVRSADGRQQVYDVVLGTLGPGAMAKLAPDMPDEYRAKLGQLQSMGAVVLTVALDRQLMRDVYWANIPKVEGLPFLALVEHTNMIDPVHYGGDHLLYIGDYLEADHRYFDLSAEDLLGEIEPYFPRFNKDFHPTWVKGAWIHKAKYAQPVPCVGYKEQIPSVRTPLPGLYLASMSQVYPWDRGTNYAVEMGRKVSGMVMEDLQTGAIQRRDRVAV